MVHSLDILDNSSQAGAARTEPALMMGVAGGLVSAAVFGLLDSSRSLWLQD